MAKTINISEEVHKAAKVEAAKQEVTLSKWIEVVILNAVKENGDDRSCNG